MNYSKSRIWRGEADEVTNSLMQPASETAISRLPPDVLAQRHHSRCVNVASKTIMMSLFNNTFSTNEWTPYEPGDSQVIDSVEADVSSLPEPVESNAISATFLIKPRELSLS